MRPIVTAPRHQRPRVFPSIRHVDYALCDHVQTRVHVPDRLNVAIRFRMPLRLARLVAHQAVDAILWSDYWKSQ